ncbi:MAG TPA: NUDIX hydrolase, partial [Jatrophihabitans sp.]|nr:NUDIX hydrolase [Jatrophihabitans sp.]
HRHWGRFGAAGLLILEADRVVLQHRAPWTHDGDTYGVPGGARDSHEDPVTAAVREAGEEAGLVRADVDPLGVYIDDHGGWSYATVVAAPARPIQPYASNAESVSVSWHRIEAVARLPLHNGFAAAWPKLRTRPPRLRLQLARELAGHPVVSELVSAGVPVARVGHPELGVHRLYPHIGEPGPSDLVLTVGSATELERLA